MKIVDYLQTVGADYYWDTGLSTDVEKVSITFTPIDFGSGSGGEYFVSNYVSTSSNKFSCGYGLTGTTLQTRIGNTTATYANELQSGVKTTVEMAINVDTRQGKINHNGKLLANPTGLSLSNNEYYINKENKHPVKIHMVMFVKNDNSVHRFLPCIDDSGNPCFYDEYNDVLIYGTGSGDTPSYGSVIEANNLNIGSGKTSGLYLGDSEIKKAYLGSDLCYLKETIDYRDELDVSTTGNAFYITNSFSSSGTDTTFRIKGKIKNTSGNGNLNFSFGIYNVNSYMNLVKWNNNTIYYNYSNGSSRILNTSWDTTVGKSFDLTIGNNYIYDNTNNVYIVSGASTQNYSGNMLINCGMMVFQSLQVYQNGTLISDCRPAVKDHIRTIYDKVNKCWLTLIQ